MDIKERSARAGRLWEGCMDEKLVPILVGSGQITQRERDPRAALDALDLAAAAARKAAEDAHGGDALLRALDAIVVLRSFSDTSWRLKSPFGGPSNSAEIDREPDRQSGCQAPDLHAPRREHAAMVRQPPVRDGDAGRDRCCHDLRRRG